MLEIVKLIGLFASAIIGGLLAIIGIIFVIGACIDIFKNELSQKRSTMRGKVFRTIKILLMIIIAPIIAFVLVSLSAYFFSFTELKEKEYQLDMDYADIENDIEMRKDNIGIKITKRNMRPITRAASSSRTISFYIKNYDDYEFKGTFKLYFKLNDLVIDVKEVDVQLKHDEIMTETYFPSDLKHPRDGFYWGNIWGNIDMEYSIEGTFIE